MFFACRKNIACYSPRHYKLQFYTSDGSDTIPDTMAMVVQYAKGSNFISLVDTFKNIKLLNANINYVDRYEQQYSPYTPYSSDLFTTDLLIVLYPSRKEYKLTNTAHDNRTMTEKKNQSYSCSDDITYMVNGEAYQCAGQTFDTSGGEAIMDIRY